MHLGSCLSTLIISQQQSKSYTVTSKINEDSGPIVSSNIISPTVISLQPGVSPPLANKKLRTISANPSNG